MNKPTTSRNRFIPFRKADLIKICLDQEKLSTDDQHSFKSFCRLLESIFHFEFHQTLETLKDCYAPFNMDVDTRMVQQYSQNEKEELQQKLVKTMTDLLKSANYRQITSKDLKEAIVEESLFKIRLEVDFNDFEDVIFYMRGESRKQETLVKYFGLKKESFEFTNYERVAVYIKFKDADYFASKKQKNINFTPGSTIIKLFRNVPKADLEMLFPNSEVRMKTIDKLIIGLPAAVSGVGVVVTKLGASLLLVGSFISFWLGLTDREVIIQQKHLIALGIGLGTLGGFLFKQFNKFKNRKIKFMKALTDSLYFKNLDNNQGVFHHLIDAAEEEEFKEAMLAYYFLLTQDEDLDMAALDHVIEKWFQLTLSCPMDFEVNDAIDKLLRLNLVEEHNGIIKAKSIVEARRILDKTWDNYFDDNRL
ncbi:MAG TPA: DUF3754 domain-containing protein [Desulfocapsa sulfexigens]|nr:DUF3754 domain-containing protein [Desulfocapsa sulfexigens]